MNRTADRTKRVSKVLPIRSLNKLLYEEKRKEKKIMGKVKEVITAGLEVLDGALEYVEVTKNEPLQFGYNEAVSFYNGCKTMFKQFTPGFEVEVVDGHHELKGV